MREISDETINKMVEKYGSKICDKLCAECRQCENDYKCSWRTEAESGYKAGINDLLSVMGVKMTGYEMTEEEFNSCEREEARKHDEKLEELKRKQNKEPESEKVLKFSENGLNFVAGYDFCYAVDEKNRRFYCCQNDKR